MEQQSETHAEPAKNQTRAKHPALLIITSLLMLTLIVAGVVGLAWGAVEFSKKEAKPARPNPKGIIVLLAKDAKILGKGGARYNVYRGVKNIGYWDELGQSLQWTIKTKSARRYQIKIRYSSCSTATCNIVCAGQTLMKTFAKTRGNSSWKTISVGTINIPANKRISFLLKPIKTSNKQVINLAEISLIPIVKK
jgi:hypothetical protein